MNNTQSGQKALNDNDLLALIFLSPFLLPLALTLVPQWRDTAATWLLDHQVLVTAADAWWVLPGIDAGVDGRRLIIVTAVAVILIAGSSTAVRAAYHRRAFRRLQSGDRQ